MSIRADEGQALPLLLLALLLAGGVAIALGRLGLVAVHPATATALLPNESFIVFPTPSRRFDDSPRWSRRARSRWASRK